MRLGSDRPFASVLLWGLSLAVVPAAHAGTTSILRLFTDGCFATRTEVELVQICEAGPRAGAPCEQMPDLDPMHPRFSIDCCVSPEHEDCFTNNPDAFCSDPTLERTCDEGAAGRTCVTNRGCDSLACTAGDPNSIGDACTSDSDCGIADPNDPTGTGSCDSARDGVCGEIDTAASELGNARIVDEETALLAIVTGIIETAQPSYNKKDRRMPDLDFVLVDLQDLTEVDPEFCRLATAFGPLQPTAAMLEEDDADR